MAVPPSDGPLFTDVESTLSPGAAGLMPSGCPLEGMLSDTLLGRGGVEGFLSQAQRANTAARPRVVVNVLQ